jgi:L-fuculose-phosphate aldolase
MTELQLRAQMCELGRRLWQRGLIGAAEGNLSVRLNSRHLLCTPSGVSKGHMKPNDLLVIDLNGNLVRSEERGLVREMDQALRPSPAPGAFPAQSEAVEQPPQEAAPQRRPSSEILLHLRCYRVRKDCMAVVHAHPPTATAFAVCGETIPDGVMPEAAYVLGSVATIPFAIPGTEEVPDAIEPLLPDHKTFLISHHGAVTLGIDLEDAYNRMETLERIAHVLLLTRQLGGAAPIDHPGYEEFLRRHLHGRLG